MGLCTTSKVITAVERSERPRTFIQGNREWVTIIECVSSKGISIPPVVILKGKEHQAPWYQESNLPQNWKLTNSVNGWTTDEIGLKWLKQVFDFFLNHIQLVQFLMSIQVTRLQSLMISAKRMQ
jgi:hypothetical protein